MTDTNWRMDSRCRTLQPAAADNIFFPGSGGKPNKAKAFCSNCPVIATCLQEAIELKLQGFFAGTTEDERTVMAKSWHVPVKPLTAALPPEPDNKKRKVYLKVDWPVEDTVTHLDSLVGPAL